MKLGIVLAIIIALMVAIAAASSAYIKGEREHMRTDVAKACIEAGGKYHETMFRRRPVCKR